MTVPSEDMLSPEHKAALEKKIKALFYQYAGDDERLQFHEMQGLAGSLAALQTRSHSLGSVNSLMTSIQHHSSLPGRRSVE